MQKIANTEDDTGCGPLSTTEGRTVKSLTQQVFEKIRSRGRISRSDVAKDLGVSPGSVTAASSALMEAGLVREEPRMPRDTSRGRPPVDLSVIPEARFVVGMNLRDGHNSAVVTDFVGRVLADCELPGAPGRKSQDAITAEIEALLDEVLSRAGLSRAALAAIGIGLPGFIDHPRGLVHWSPILRDRGLAMGAVLGPRLDCPVHLDNDVNLLALAELWFGMGRQRSNFAVVTIEHGVGMGLILDTELYRGAKGMGLEIGHTTVQLDGALCRCGQRGCLEAYIADYALVREASTALEWDLRVARSPQQTLEILFDQAKAGNEAARLIFERAGRYLSRGLANVIQVFDPDLLLISGARLRYDLLYAEEVLSEMHRFSDRIGRERTEVAINTWGDTVWARGAAALALSMVTDEVASHPVPLLVQPATKRGAG
ncbi:XylR family transcriptional regulator [Meridianimarinicoccus roseus]|uniref:XylR family transcriptional regulator n=1 Tax=Meridianimarinicoccus roseus TaxID=2072018 RepID=A0A2V2LEJ7_9RHOB|nr:ROK family transcriptional regulator [Meridianimarinicoccus roseus]PWR02291.1 XylR family transcriptional regulator [Meridianimarinicoccus roseus]